MTVIVKYECYLINSNVYVYYLIMNCINKDLFGLYLSNSWFADIC